MLSLRYYLLDSRPVKSLIEDFIAFSFQNAKQVIQLRESGHFNHSLNKALIQHDLIFLSLLLHHRLSTTALIVLILGGLGGTRRRRLFVFFT